jgi:hypothetical protein
MKKDFIELENGEIVKLSDIKKITKRYSSKHTNGLEPFVKTKKACPISNFLGIFPTKFIEKDCFKLGPCNGRYGSWYNKYYYSLKELFDAIIEHWGEQSPGAFGGYSKLPNAEYCAGWLLTPNKNALYFDEKENAICIKPHITIWFDDFQESYSGMWGHINPRRKFITFNTNNELNEWMKNNISILTQ